jgi:hypothetical protein
MQFTGPQDPFASDPLVNNRSPIVDIAVTQPISFGS